MKVIITIASSTDNSETTIVSEARANHRGESGRGQKRIFIQNSAVEVDAAQPFISQAAAIEADAGASWEDGGEFAFKGANAGNDARVFFEVGPAQVFGLVERGSDVSISGRGICPGIIQRGSNKSVDESDGFAGPAMGDDEDPSFFEV